MSPVGDTLTRDVHPAPALNVSPNPESAYNPTATSGPADVAAVAPVATTPPDDPVLPVAVRLTSTTPAPDTADTPAYSNRLAPISALSVARTVTVGLDPPPATTGAVHELSSVPSDATVDVNRVHALPAESDTDPTLAPPTLQIPT